ncbi:NETI motif-containing protein [Gracilibacillus oryzae]|uniref:NETI motif-containing protein n=1 Tax=Gracilibacillus oryzae TaxID=1672701 RepID=A0A7C8GSL0_9BACI|nr:NETI motif-containing protein [Gracilibacillus oryzae]KAB8129884.1 NETI motif-containing protein [Gracilibacillus oryzae]
MKKVFQVEKNETIDDCLNRIKQEGYQPVRRIEKPVFEETDNGIEPAEQNIQFEAILLKHER